jgi:DsbC/DsbD-like thiol-disulfide interchange protein
MIKLLFQFATWPAAALAACAIVSLNLDSAAAADASSWDQGLHSKARLVAGGDVRTNGARTLRAGVEIALDDRWKTYWRYPGDSGIPPRFDFSRSENVKHITVLWPAPHAFRDESGVSIGYKSRVIFPLHIEPQRPGQPVALRLKLDYAVCEKLCLPVDADLEVVVTGEKSEHDAALQTSEARVPKPAQVGADGPLAVRAIKRDDAAAPPRILVDVAAPGPVELFAEGPTPEWALPLPAPVPGAAAGAQRFAFELDGLPPGANAKGAVLRLTAVGSEGAIEVSARLD